MSKLKYAELDDSAIFIAEKLLVEIETLIDSMSKNEKFKDPYQVKNLNKLVHTYNQLKPYM